MAFPFFQDVVSSAAFPARQRPRISSATEVCWTRHTTARWCAPLASPVVRKGAKQWRRGPSGLVGGPALRSYSKRRAKGSADLSARRTRLRVRFTVPRSRSPHVSCSDRLRTRKYARTEGYGRKCTAKASNGPLVSDQVCCQSH